MAEQSGSRCCLLNCTKHSWPCQSSLSAPVGEKPTRFIPLRFLRAKAAKSSGFWAPSKSPTIAQSTQKGWAGKERWSQTSLRMLLERNLVPETPIRLHGRRGITQVRDRATSPDWFLWEKKWRFPLHLREPLTKENQEERQPPAAISYTWWLALILAVKLCLKMWNIKGALLVYKDTFNYIFVLLTKSLHFYCLGRKIQLWL